MRSEVRNQRVRKLRRIRKQIDQLNDELDLVTQGKTEDLLKMNAILDSMLRLSPEERRLAHELGYPETDEPK